MNEEIMDYWALKEWETLIDALMGEKEELWVLKEQYAEDSERIIDETDFKEIYGRNNEGIRKMHVKQELHDDYVQIKKLELSISRKEHRISFLREMVRSRRVSLELLKK